MDTEQPFDRERSLARLEREEFDLAVIGGGINGAAIARDAAMRGLRVALVERGDFAGGTSSRSSKLIHGGFRYLPQGQLRLVYSALRERELLRRRADRGARGQAPFRGPGPGSEFRGVRSGELARTDRRATTPRPL